MTRQKRKIVSGLVTLGLLVGGIGYLFASSAGEAFEYYKHVDEVMSNTAQWDHKHLQMHGFVVPGSIKKRVDKEHSQIEYKFDVVNCGSKIEARYAGTVPDTFKDRAEVVLKGSLTDGRFLVENDGVSAKCPSKYQAKPDGPAATLCTRGDTNVTSSTAMATPPPPATN
jgi:cytochrome c-type biogenesis protein CcmE